MVPEPRRGTSRGMNVLGLIPARSGSTGVPGKNVRDLGGRPLLAWTVEAARSSRLARVVLSTDDAAYAKIGRAAGAEAPFLRPPSLAAVDSRAIGVVDHCLGFLETEENWVPDAVFYLQPTSPFRTPAHIDEAIALLERHGRNSVISVTDAPKHPWFMFLPDGDGRARPLLQLDARPERRQDMPKIWALNDTVLLSRTHYLRNAAKTDGLVVDIDDFTPIEIFPPANVDINTEFDFMFAEFVAIRELGVR